MAFMRHNRAVNGAVQPEAVASSDEARQREQLRLQTIPVDGELGAPQMRTFPADLLTIEAITRRHVMGGLDSPDWPDGYEEMVPVGPKMP